jgi:hypothetical protein
MVSNVTNVTNFIERSLIEEEDRFPGLAELLEDFLTPQLELDADPMQPDRQYGLFVERLALDLPLEFQTLRDSDNRLTLGTSPPTQWIETSVQPVLHRLRVTLERDDDESRNETMES